MQLLLQVVAQPGDVPAVLLRRRRAVGQGEGDEEQEHAGEEAADGIHAAGFAVAAPAGHRVGGTQHARAHHAAADLSHLALWHGIPLIAWRSRRCRGPADQPRVLSIDREYDGRIASARTPRLVSVRAGG